MSAKTKRIAEVLFFLLVMGLTFFAVFYHKNMSQLIGAVQHMKPAYGILAMSLGLAFVCLEGTMIWYLLAALNGKSSLLRCIQYSFIGFFYSGITPSATGGQPMQLYYMTKDGNRASDSSVVLMTVALIYKFVLVLIGVALFLFWRGPLIHFLGKYFVLYLIGIVLNIVLVIAIWAVMVCPGVIRKLMVGVSHLLKRDWNQKIDGFIQGYQDAVCFLKANPWKVFVVTILTFIQRSTVFILTYVVYLGFGFHEESAFTVIALQAAVYIAVDMLPIPGAQGITELMYQALFLPIFTSKFLDVSMLVSRGVNFYFPLIVSLTVVLVNCAVRVRRSVGASNLA